MIMVAHIPTAKHPTAKGKIRHILDMARTHGIVLEIPTNWKVLETQTSGIILETQTSGEILRLKGKILAIQMEIAGIIRAHARGVIHRILHNNSSMGAK